jgi:hypothetical protein
MSGIADKDVFSRRAKEILNDPVIVNIVEAQQADIIREWLDTPLSDVNRREQLFHRARATKSMLDELRSLSYDTVVKEYNKRKGSV